MNNFDNNIDTDFDRTRGHGGLGGFVSQNPQRMQCHARALSPRAPAVPRTIGTKMCVWGEGGDQFGVVLPFLSSMIG